MTQDDVVSVAKECSDTLTAGSFPGATGVIVVHAKTVLTVGRDLSADGASATLCLQQSFVLLPGQAVVVFDLTKFVASPAGVVQTIPGPRLIQAGETILVEPLSTRSTLLATLIVSNQCSTLDSATR